MEELKLTVYFEDPFWVGVFERTQNGTLSVCKITFGAEPKDYAVHAYVLRHFTSCVSARRFLPGSMCNAAIPNAARGRCKSS